MANAAILIGNSHYGTLRSLACCQADLRAMKELLEATERYPDICVVEDVDADALKSKIRGAIQNRTSTDELFFYFTGHGYQNEGDFYLCAANFDVKAPNATGLSTAELHELLRLANANLVVKVVDACNSGTLLIKAESPFSSHEKGDFKNLIQISSCREDQNSLTGKSLSLFTEAFRAAALRKLDGTVYYTDIVTSLRDSFIGNEDQTPFFVSQATGREFFVEAAHRLDALRKHLGLTLAVSTGCQSQQQDLSPAPRSLQDLLEAAEQMTAKRETIDSFIGEFFDALVQSVSTDEFPSFFDLGVVEHADFEEPTAEGFITRVLSRQDRLDEFVTATRKRTATRNPLSMIGVSWLLGIAGDDQRYREIYDLQLNCEMKRAQIKFTFTPKYHSLKKIVLVVSCAPSLNHCYVFEIGTQHKLTDFQEFSTEGDEAVRRWYKLDWSDNSARVVKSITLRLHEIVKGHLEQTERILTANKE